MSEPPSGAGLCGTCMPTTIGCTTDDECDDGFICFTQPAETCQCMGGDRVCAPACTESSCGAGQVCESDGHCAPSSCADDGFECASDLTCDPERSGADGNGCVARSCESDGYECLDDTVCNSGLDVVVDAAVDVHGCRALSCSEGLECPRNTRCNPTGPGCVPQSCTADMDCDCGFCIGSQCADELNTCYVLPV